MDDQQEALATLRKLLPTGALHVIRVTHRCVPGLHAITPRTAEEQAACDAFSAESGYPTTHPRHFEHSPVVQIEGPDARGRCRAVAEDGSYTVGYPVALLKRLMQYAMAG